MKSIITRVPCAFISSLLLFGSAGCLDRKPAPVCPVPIEVGSNSVKTGGFDGVDLLAVVDNSSSMEQEQQILTAGFYTLINALVNPPEEWPFPPVDTVRLAVVSSDLGLQYGEARETALSPAKLGNGSCNAGGNRGDDGAFRTISAVGNVVTVLDDQIPCTAGGDQCPIGYTCTDGYCRSDDGTERMVCPLLETPFAETRAAAPNDVFTAQSACLAVQGTEGCGIEQQLEAAVRGLERPDNAAFVVDSHVLAVLTVSDEEDCSIEDPGLFKTTDWLEGTNLNVACNRTPENEAHLFDVSRYREKLLAIKGNRASAVIFAAIVGVPNEDTVCQGTGDEIAAAGCLDHPKMQLSLGTIEDTEIVHFNAACQRRSTDGETLITDARPGRRFVRTAQAFGDQGYVYSICNGNWSGAMTRIAELIAAQMQPSCFSKKLGWNALSADESERYPDCPNCGFAACDAVFEQHIPKENLGDSLCPPALYEGLPKTERDRYESMIVTTDVGVGGEISTIKVSCPVPKLPAPLDCVEATAQTADRFTDRAGWYYCESEGEDQLNSCIDGKDNNRDGRTDCDDSSCQSCTLCGGTQESCREGCPYRVVFNHKAETAAAAGTLSIQCLQQFTFADKNCREDSPNVCRDNRDNDGNGAFDCDDTMHSGDSAAHRADPNCCPMEERDGKCVTDLPALLENCGHSAALVGITPDMDPALAARSDACKEKARILNCNW